MDILHIDSAITGDASVSRQLTAQIVEDIEKASFALLDYLGRRLAGKPVAALSMFPQYRAVQEAAGAERIHPADLWSVDWQWRELPSDTSVPPRALDASTRSAMEGHLLGIMRTPHPTLAAARMSEGCAGLGAAARDPHDRLDVAAQPGDARHLGEAAPIELHREGVGELRRARAAR